MLIIIKFYDYDDSRRWETLVLWQLWISLPTAAILPSALTPPLSRSSSSSYGTWSLSSSSYDTSLVAHCCAIFLWDDRHQYPMSNNKDHLVGQLTTCNPDAATISLEPISKRSVGVAAVLLMSSLSCWTIFWFHEISEVLTAHLFPRSKHQISPYLRVNAMFIIFRRVNIVHWTSKGLHSTGNRHMHRVRRSRGSDTA